MLRLNPNFILIGNIQMFMFQIKVYAHAVFVQTLHMDVFRQKYWYIICIFFSPNNARTSAQQILKSNPMNTQNLHTPNQYQNWFWY